LDTLLLGRERQRKMLERCAKCVLLESYPGITFDKQGTCNYCLSHKRRKYRGKEDLFNLVASYRNNNTGKYDCLVAVSGGRDSAFAAYYAVRILKLRVLVYTYDNGFMPEQTKENVKNIVDILDVDHVIEKYEYMGKNTKHILSSWMRKPSPAMIAFLCTGCQTDYKRGLVKTAQSNKIRLVITGAGEPERSFATRLLASRLLRYGKRKRKSSLILGFLREIFRNPYYILSLNCLTAFTREFFYRYVYKYSKDDLNNLRLFKYIEWNEEMLLSVIQKELGWKNPPHSGSSWRSDCKIHPLRQYLYGEMLGFTKNDEIISGMIRENMIIREEALRKLENDNLFPQEFQEFLAELLDELGLAFSDLKNCVQKA
jgi:tRNA(Ile)-lysidine synthase TilS/MesJ